MYKIYNNASNEFIGEIDFRELMFLKSLLEEESLEDKDYAITAMTIAYFEEEGVDKELIDLLKKALGTKEEVVIRWERGEG
jgi:hypothetical protein